MKKNIAILLAVCVLLILNGCATSSPPLKKITYQDLESRNENGSQVTKDYTLGLALAGGGTKASSFSMGVLEGLSETEIINQTDAISSVSGGGYAALWFYSRLLNPENQEQLDNRHGLNSKILTFFQDCFAIRYSESFGTKLTETCPDKDTFFVVSEPDNIDPFRHQNYIRGYQDIFSIGTDALGNPAFHMGVTSDNNRLSNDIMQLTAKTFGASIINFIPNILFDWEVPLSPSRAAYKKGILRTYGAKVDECKAKKFCDETREEGDTNFVYELKFDELRKAYKAGKVPLWIINTTAGENRGLFDFSPQSSFTLTSYEMTPFGAGSGLYDYYKFEDADYVNKLPAEEKVSDAIIMSAAFFDEQQKVLTPKYNWIINPLQSLFTLNWGYSRSNPQVSKSKRVVHKLLPWPFYYFHGFNRKDSVNIRFSDGGQSENLGAYALIRRNVSDIIISDHSQDRGGQMADICVLKNNLEKLPDEEARFVYVPGLDNLQEVCNDQEVKKGYKLGYNIFEWTHPILLGCISKSKDKNSCTKDEYVTNRLYIIKPAIPAPSEEYTKIGLYLPQDLEDQRYDCNQLKVGTPYTIKELDSNNWKFEEEVPCELAGFWKINNNKYGNGINKDDDYPYFPQHTTVGLTINSSNWIYGASRELARYYSRQLFWFFGNNANKDSIKNKFKLVLERQSTDPIKPKLSKQGILGADVAKD